MIQMRRRFRKRTIVIGSIVLAAVVLAITATLIIHQISHNNKQTIIENPGYATILPTGANIVDLGGWKRVSPEGKTPVYAFADILDNVPISVSEQTLPSSFSDDIDGHVSELAKSYNASATIAQGETTIYIGSSAKGPQSVIFTKNNLLVLIKSEKKIEDATWSSYVASLQ